MTASGRKWNQNRMEEPENKASRIIDPKPLLEFQRLLYRQGNRMNESKSHHSSTVSQEIGGGGGGTFF